MFEIKVAARDPNSVLDDALRSYYNYCACVRAAAPSLGPSSLNLDATVVRMPTDPPILQWLPVKARRFHMRGRANRELFEELDVLTAASPLAAAFLRNFSE